MFKTPLSERRYPSLILACLSIFLLQVCFFSFIRQPLLHAQLDLETSVDDAPAEGFTITSFTINGSSPVTDIHEVNLRLEVDGEIASLQVRYAKEGEDWGEWEPYVPVRSWLLPAGDGPRTVHAQLRDAAGNIAPADAYIYIYLPVKSITLDQAELRLRAGGEPARLQALVLPADATSPQVYWRSSDESVAVLEDGLVTPAGAGEAIITAAAGACSASCLVTVKPAISISRPAAPAEAEISYGDINGDGKVNVVDAVMVLRSAADLLELDESLRAAADVYRDGCIDTKDAVVILRFITGQVGTLPVEPDEEPAWPDPVAAPPLPSYLPPTQIMLDAVYRVSAIGTVLGDGLRVRSGPGTTYNILGQIDTGTRVTVYEKVRGSDPGYPDWYRIIYNNKDGYIAADFVSVEATLYGLDYWNNRAYICTAPAELMSGDYKIDAGFAFYRLEGSNRVPTGITFNFLERTPYALLYLERPAGGAITADYLALRASQIRPDSPFNRLGDAFIRAQETWGVNALYLMAHAALESYWGISSIARDKNNIYGFMAYDNDPYGSAAVFRSMADCIMHCSGYIRREYHNYGGRWFNGANLVGMNVFYASDSMWAFKIANTMESILPYSKYEHVQKCYQRGQTTEDLNLRAAPDLGAAHITVIPAGASLSLRGMTLAGEYHWHNLLYDEYAGWSSGRWINLVDSPRAAVYFFDWYKAGGEGIRLEVRSGPGSDTALVDSLPFGTVFHIKEITTAYDAGAGRWYSWYRISYPGSAEQSWVRGDCVVTDW